GFLEPACLAREAVKLVGRGQYALPPAPVEARIQAHHELMRVWREHDLVGLGKMQMTGDMLLRFGQHLAEHLVPLAAGQAGRVVPVGELCRARYIWPRVMAVRGAMQPITAAAEKLAEVALKLHASGNPA